MTPVQSDPWSGRRLLLARIVQLVLIRDLVTGTSRGLWQYGNHSITRNHVVAHNRRPATGTNQSVAELSATNHEKALEFILIKRSKVASYGAEGPSDGDRGLGWGRYNGRFGKSTRETSEPCSTRPPDSKRH